MKCNFGKLFRVSEGLLANNIVVPSTVLKNMFGNVLFLRRISQRNNFQLFYSFE